MVLAVCLLLVGLVAVNGTLAQAVEDIFTSISTALGFDEPQRNETKLDVALASYYRQGDALVEGEHAQTLVPVDRDWNEKVTVNLDGATYWLWEQGAVDKFTAVKNNSPEKDAYFRIAFAVDEAIFGKLKLNFSTCQDYTWTEWTEIAIGGKAFRMLVATYTLPLAPGEVSPPTLLQAAMDKSATSEDYARIGSDFLQIKVMAVDADALAEEIDGQLVRKGALETLDATLPLRAGFNPF